MWAKSTMDPEWFIILALFHLDICDDWISEFVSTEDLFSVWKGRISRESGNAVAATGNALDSKPSIFFPMLVLAPKETFQTWFKTRLIFHSKQSEPLFRSISLSLLLSLTHTHTLINKHSHDHISSVFLFSRLQTLSHSLNLSITQYTDSLTLTLTLSLSLSLSHTHTHSLSISLSILFEKGTNVEREASWLSNHF